MKGFRTDYSYAGFMPDGSTQEFVSDEEYREQFETESDTT